MIKPEYYHTDSVYEPFKIIKHYEMDFFLGNVLKYIVRAGKKNPATELQDLEKAMTYLQDRINELKPKPVPIPYDLNKLIGGQANLGLPKTHLQNSSSISVVHTATINLIIKKNEISFTLAIPPHLNELSLIAKLHDGISDAETLKDYYFQTIDFNGHVWTNKLGTWQPVDFKSGAIGHGYNG